jgi:hypothetical protein
MKGVEEIDHLRQVQIIHALRKAGVDPELQNMQGNKAVDLTTEKFLQNAISKPFIEKKAKRKFTDLEIEKRLPRRKAFVIHKENQNPQNLAFTGGKSKEKSIETEDKIEKPQFKK